MDSTFGGILFLLSGLFVFGYFNFVYPRLLKRHVKKIGQDPDSGSMKVMLAVLRVFATLVGGAAMIYGATQVVASLSR